MKVVSGLGGLSTGKDGGCLGRRWLVVVKGETVVFVVDSAANDGLRWWSKGEMVMEGFDPRVITEKGKNGCALFLSLFLSDGD